jgi:ribosomal protein L13
VIVLARRSQSSPGGATARRTATHSDASAACSLYIPHPEVTLLYRYIIDAEGQTLGRLASLVARYIRGKNLPTYSPSMDMGSMVIIINAGKVKVGGRKTDDKLYKRHVNGLPGSMKVETFRQLQARVPERIIEKAVWGMLPKGRLGRRIKLNLKVRLCAAAYLRTLQACGLRRSPISSLQSAQHGSCHVISKIAWHAPCFHWLRRHLLSRPLDSFGTC